MSKDVGQFWPLKSLSISVSLFCCSGRGTVVRKLQLLPASKVETSLSCAQTKTFRSLKRKEISLCITQMWRLYRKLKNQLRLHLMTSDSGEFVHFKRQHNGLLLESRSIKAIQASWQTPPLKQGEQINWLLSTTLILHKSNQKLRQA